MYLNRHVSSRQSQRIQQYILPLSLPPSATSRCIINSLTNGYAILTITPTRQGAAFPRFVYTLKTPKKIDPFDMFVGGSFGVVAAEALLRGLI